MLTPIHPEPGGQGVAQPASCHGFGTDRGGGGGGEEGHQEGQVHQQLSKVHQDSTGIQTCANCESVR